ncbi:hypothetical protein SNE40_013958 [Patella caerulea]|uniref:UBC core domain-containing protein n=1 Tax=Patella caerulea TaxID=87958 RepID=A0AAN8JHA4_PATCE
MKFLPLMKEVQQLMKDIDSISNSQVKVESFKNRDTLTNRNGATILRLEIKPNDGYYNGTTHYFNIIITADYPDEPPVIQCETSIFHPNIVDMSGLDDQGSNICLNILEESNWDPTIGLGGCVIGILYLLYNPQLDDPWNTERFSESEFAERLKKCLSECTIENDNKVQIPKQYNQIILLDDDDDDDDDDADVDADAGDDELEKMDDSLAPSKEMGAILQENEINMGQTISENETSEMDVDICELMVPEYTCETATIKIDSKYELEDKFTGYKLTRHGTTAIPDLGINTISSFPFLVKRFTV